jgi:hypothetical protein
MTADGMVQRPTREEWRQHKDEIVRLYVNEDMRLDEVRQLMERKYNLEATMAALVRNIENRKRGGKRSLVYKNGVPFSRAKIASHLKKKGMTADQLLRKVPSDASMPAGFTCVTPPPEQVGDTPSSHSNPFTPSDQFSITDTPPTSGGDSGSSNSGSFPTPQLTPNQSQEDSRAPPLLPSPEAAPLPDAYPGTTADFNLDFGPDSMQITGQGFDNLITDQFTLSSIVDISGQVLSFSSPNSCQSSNGLDVNFHISMSTCTNPFSAVKEERHSDPHEHLPMPSRKSSFRFAFWLASCMVKVRNRVPILLLRRLSRSTRCSSSRNINMLWHVSILCLRSFCRRHLKKCATSGALPSSPRGSSHCDYQLHGPTSLEHGEAMWYHSGEVARGV